MSLSPQVCKKSYKVKIPTLGENCEFWLITVTDESGITNPNKDHAYLTDDGKLFVFNGDSLVRVNCDICFTQEEREKLEGIEENANNYTLPEADSNHLGGVVLGYTQNGKNYPVVKDSDGRIYVQVPWVEYSLPQAETNTLGGIKTGYEKQGQNYPVLVDVDGNAYVNVPWTATDTKYNVVSTTENGLAPMLPTENADKKFLNGEGEWVEVNESINGNTVTGSTFSGETSDCGVQILEVQGKTVQNGTPSPDSPVEIENVEISKIISHGRQLFDSSKLATKSQGGATVTNNGDGSFTVSGSGNLTDNFANMQYSINSYDFKKLFKVGNVYLKGAINKGIYFEVVYIKSGGNLYQRNDITINLTNEIYNAITSVSIIFYGNSGNAIPNETIKPMLYQEGDGTWEPYQGATVETSLTLAEGDTYENGQITRTRKQVVFDGSSDEAWTINSTNEKTYRFNNLLSDSLGDLWLDKTGQACNRLPVGNTWSEIKGDCFSIDNSKNLTVYIDELKNSTLEEFKTWLSTHNLVVEYELETPTTEELKIPTVPSYYPYTDVSTDSEVDPTITFRPLPFTTCLVGEATEEESGYMPPLSGNSNEFLNGNGEWSVPSGYTLPQASTTTLGGVKIGSNITVSSGTISLTKANVVSALGYTPPTTNTTYALATTSTNGLMSSTDKSRLDQLWAKFDSMVFFTND